MSQARGAEWSLTLAPSWQADDDEDCVCIVRPGVGALQIGAAPKDTSVTDEDLADFAADHLDAGAGTRPVALGDFSGIAIRQGADGIQWRQWFLRHGPVALFVTYNCAEADRGVEDADIDRMLGSLRAPSNGGQSGRARGRWHGSQADRHEETADSEGELSFAPETMASFVRLLALFSQRDAADPDFPDVVARREAEGYVSYTRTSGSRVWVFFLNAADGHAYYRLWPTRKHGEPATAPAGSAEAPPATAAPLVRNERDLHTLGPGV